MYCKPSEYSAYLPPTPKICDESYVQVAFVHRTGTMFNHCQGWAFLLPFMSATFIFILILCIHRVSIVPTALDNNQVSNFLRKFVLKLAYFLFELSETAYNTNNSYTGWYLMINCKIETIWYFANLYQRVNYTQKDDKSQIFPKCISSFHFSVCQSQEIFENQVSFSP